MTWEVLVLGGALALIVPVVIALYNQTMIDVLKELQKRRDLDA
jgi:hypothetical protein